MHSYITASLILWTAIKVSMSLKPCSTTLETSFAEAKITPDVIDKPPCQIMSVEFDTMVKPGDKLTQSKAQNQPKVKWEVQNGKFYTLVMIDPDVRNPSYLHWLVVNIPGYNVGQGKVVAGYNAHTPPKNTGYHRYVILAFEQTMDNINVESVERPKFKIKQFMKTYKLNEIATEGNFFKVKGK